jgi:type I restriction enzyme S subunit
MNSEWQVFRLGEVTSCSSGSTPSKQNPKFWGGDVPWVSAKDMKTFYLYGSEDGITEEALSEGAKIAPKGAVLVLNRGMTLLNDVPVCLLKSDSSFNQDVKAFQSCDPVLASEYLPYLLLGHKSELQSLVDLAGHGTGRLATDLLLALETSLPSPREQKAIAHLLATLDDKIELNRRTNETLEAMAKALFQSWFVDFDPVRAKAEGRPTGLPDEISELFPDSFEDSDLGEIPSGWRVQAVGDVIECVGGSTPSTSETEYWDDGEYFWATPKDLSSLSEPFILDTAKKITEAGVQRISSGVLPAGTVLLSSRAPVGYIAVTTVPLSINQGFIALKSSDLGSSAYLLNWCLSNVQQFKDRASGTTFPEISKAAFRPIPFLVPSKQIMTAFSTKAQVLYDRVVLNMKQSDCLAKSRDALLPKLISGELRIPEAEKLLKQAGV